MLVSKALAAKAGVVVATAGIAVTGVSAVASASTTAPAAKTGTTWTATAGTGHVRKHFPHYVDTITGQLTTTATPAADVARARVVLRREDKKGHWVVVQFGRTGKLGKVRFHVRALKNGGTFELVFRGNRADARSVSAPIVIAAVK
jgi:hypothetical protein